MSVSIYGLKLDADGRCQHYHGPTDIIANKCARCQQYFACYQCHDALQQHEFVPISLPTDEYVVCCGHCRHELTWSQYQTGACPFCQRAFNPKCTLHHAIYFTSSK
ncbi:CHY zinc finger protein [Loigolactobacillus zhaoyuanensis]|uniref:CHY zinc finger protein n=1 Tax=Loigolactobacillus zhaoyuanensis TaxID=2486017 RepID=A0ABW8UFS0_9LACO|nr:CHY zinc finger protein [Loigolactobacillus zhaoyuanensis]